MAEPSAQSLRSRLLQQRRRQDVAGRSSDTRQCPASTRQRGLWYQMHAGGNPATYNVPITLELHGVPDPPRLERAFGEVVRRHDALRTTFAVRDGKLLQTVHGDTAVRVEVTEHAVAGGVADDPRLSYLLHAFARAPFDLERGPLFRLGVVVAGPERYFLQLVLHHIVTDGWSAGVVLDEFERYYLGGRRGG